jgi:hypothetical protein
MSEEHFPVDLQISAEDFMACGWKDILSGALQEGYSPCGWLFLLVLGRPWRRIGKLTAKCFGCWPMRVR